MSDGAFPDSVIGSVRAILVTYNTGPSIASVVSSLLGIGFQPSQVFVTDNDSHPLSRQLLERLPPGVNIFVNTENKGFAKAANGGIRAAIESGGKVILLLNPDLELTSETLSRFLEIIRDAPDCQIFGPDRQGNSSALRRAGDVRTLEKSGKKPVLKPAKRLSGACLAVRTSAFVRAGLLDEDFFLYREDTEFCMRARDAGLRLMEVKGLLIPHLVARGSSVPDSFRVFHSARGCSILIRKRSRNPLVRAILAVDILGTLVFELGGWIIKGARITGLVRHAFIGLLEGGAAIVHAPPVCAARSTP